jgi:hypothetical protein
LADFIKRAKSGGFVLDLIKNEQSPNHKPNKERTEDVNDILDKKTDE